MSNPAAEREDMPGYRAGMTSISSDSSDFPRYSPAELEERIHDLERRLQYFEDNVNVSVNGVNSLADKDAFMATFCNVPPLSERIVSDGLPGLDRLKNNVLQCGRRHSSTRDDAVAAVGEGGLGKTTACILVAHDEDVMKMFSGGIYFVQMRASSRDVDVVRQLAHIVRLAGGVRSNDVILGLSGSLSVERAVDEATRWFEVHDILLVVDNVWRRLGRDGGAEWIPTLSKIVAKPGSCLLFSTRDTQLANYVQERVVFNRLDLEVDSEKAVARSLFERYASVSNLSNGEHQEESRGSSSLRHEEEAKQYEFVVNHVLNLSDGWPIAIEAAGAFAKTWKLRKNGSYHGLLPVISRRLNQLKGMAGDVSLWKIWEASIKFTQELAAENDGYSELFHELDVCSMRETGYDWLEKNIFTLVNIEPRRPISMGDIAKELKISDDQAEPFAELCAQLGLGTIVLAGDSEQDESVALQLHSLLYEYAPEVGHKNV